MLHTTTCTSEIQARADISADILFLKRLMCLNSQTHQTSPFLFLLQLCLIYTHGKAVITVDGHQFSPPSASGQVDNIISQKPLWFRNLPGTGPGVEKIEADGIK